MSVNVDDTDSHIRYSGDWDALVGSTRQWGAGTVHSTSQNGASATITFTGTRIVMYCTLFHGTGNEIANINFDGKTTTVSKPSQSQDVYNDVWFDSGEILGIQHTLVVSNGGGPSDTPFQLDQFFIEGTVDAPSAPPPPPPPTSTGAPNQGNQDHQKTATTTQTTTAVVTATSGAGQTQSSTSASNPSSPSSTSATRSGTSNSGVSSTSASAISTMTSGGATIISVQYIPTASANVSSADQIGNSSNAATPTADSKNLSVGGIVGGIIGAISFILFLLLLLLLLRRHRRAKQHIQLTDDTERNAARPRKLTTVTPFHVGGNSMTDQPPAGGTVSYRGVFTPKHSIPAAEAQGVISPTSATSSTSMYATGYTDGTRRSIEKGQGTLSDASHQTFLPFTDMSPTTNSLLRSPSYQEQHNAYDQSQVPALYGLRRPSGDAIVMPPLDPIHVPFQDADDIRPPSYHRSVGN